MFRRRVEAARNALVVIKGYNFGMKVPVAIDEEAAAKLAKEKPNHTIEDLIEAAVIKKQVKEHSTDVARLYVDTGRLLLPYDKNLISQLNGQTWTFSQSQTDAYGNRAKKFCVDTSTEIMTGTGWRFWDMLEEGKDEALTLNPRTGMSEWQPIEKIFHYPGPHDLISMEATTHSSLTTPDHRWIVERYRAHHKDRVWDWRTTEELGSLTPIPRVVPCAELPTMPKYEDDFVELVAWYWTEGNVVFDRGRPTSSFSQSRRVYPENCDRIEWALCRLIGPPGPQHAGHHWNESVDVDNFMTYRLSPEVTQVLLDVVHGPDKLVTPEFIRSMTKSQLDLFIHVSILADGTDRLVRGSDGSVAPSIVISQSVAERVRRFEMACALADRPTNTSYSAKHGQTSCALLATRRAAPNGSITWGRAHGGVATVHHDGAVWCPKTANGTWLARRRGTVYYTGNSEGAFHAFDGLRMALFGHAVQPLEDFLNKPPPKKRPVFERFMGGP